MDYTAPPAVEYQQPAPINDEASLLGPMTTSFNYMREAQASRDERGKYHFTYTWFDEARPVWDEQTSSLRGKPLHILEVGSFEGCSTTWMLDNLMDNEASSLTAIDTFGGGNESAPASYDTANLEQIFLDNINLAKNSDKVRVMKGFSPDQLVQLRQERAQFDLIYIDGSHMAIDVLQDAALAWPMLKEGGILVFDDYGWNFYKQEYYNPHVAITSFIKCAAPTLEWKVLRGQLWAKKIPNTTVPEPNK